MGESVLFLDESKCVKCYACVRSCPVKAIQVCKESSKPTIVDDRCIACGNCLSACSYSAIKTVSNIEQVERLLQSENKVAAICDPSIAGEFDDIRDYRKFVTMIRRIGFDYVCEVSFGVDLIANKQATLCEKFQGRSFISSHCPVANMYVEKYQPSLVNSLSPIVPAAVAMASVVRKHYGEETKIVNITPCLGIKKDNSRYEKNLRIDAFLTFVELRRLFEKYEIKEEFAEFSDFDEPTGYKGSLYPIAEGFVEACGMNNEMLNRHFLNVEGKNDVPDVLKQFSKHSNEFNTHFNLYFCKGCLMGPGCTKGQKFVRHNLVTEYAKKKIETLDKEKWQENIDKYANKSDLVAFYKADDKTLPNPTKEEIEAAFAKLGKQAGGKHTNCRSCGYDTCTELAIAMAQGIATPEMCFAYTQKGSRDADNRLRNTKTELVDLQNECNDLKDELNSQKLGNGELVRSLSLIIHHIYPGIAIVDSKMKVTESNNGFIEILGDEAKEIDEIIPGLIGASIKSLLPQELYNQVEYVLKTSEDILNKDIEYNGHLINVSIFTLIPQKSVCMIFRNLYAEEERPEEIIHRVNEVIKETLLQVQQIGFILGEGAAKTEKQLRSIIKTISMK
ncbi:MAG: [Fe-Fe] hydrogenase large subunit C-terminal domain-containing protein [Bacteroidales bacterium]|nr:[Fe-Fe] hydrogenase large subunit C-terminal domain-containing protein [Bacteroidales bacterium]